MQESASILILLLQVHKQSMLAKCLCVPFNWSALKCIKAENALHPNTLRYWLPQPLTSLKQYPGSGAPLIGLMQSSFDAKRFHTEISKTTGRKMSGFGIRKTLEKANSETRPKKKKAISIALPGHICSIYLEINLALPNQGLGTSTHFRPAGSRAEEISSKDPPSLCICLHLGIPRIARCKNINCFCSCWLYNRSTAFMYP